MKVYYVNSNNEQIDLLSAPYHIEETDFFYFEWSYETENRRVTRFYRDVETKKVSVDIFSQNQKDFYSALNRLVEIFDVDNVSNVKGKLFYNDYYIECNIFKNQKDMKSYILPYAKVDLTLVTDSTKWIKEDTYHFYSTGEGRKTGTKKYSYKYPYVYGASEGQMTVRNIGVVENDVLLRIYGPAQDPAIKIGDNLYQINTTLEANERLEIDTMKKKAVKITAHGDEINVFNDRNKDNRLYVPIPPGTNIVVWNNSFSFDIVVYDARSEPKWESDE